MLRKIITCLAVFMLLPANSNQKKPHWTHSIPQKDNYKFYVGYSSSAESQDIAIKGATQDAYNQAIQQSFGIETSLNIKSKETMTTVKYTKDFKGISEKINFIDFRRKNIHIEKKGKVFQVWILFQYPLAEIMKEQKRINKMMKKQRLNQKTYFMGKLEYERGNIKKAMSLWEKSCNDGNKDGCDYLMLIEQKNKRKKLQLEMKMGKLEYERGNIKKAISLWEKACNNGNVDGCDRLILIEQDNKRKKLQLEMKMGKLEYERGNIKKAISLWEKACNNGNVDGCDRLILIEQDNKSRKLQFENKKNAHEPQKEDRAIAVAYDQSASPSYKNYCNSSGELKLAEHEEEEENIFKAKQRCTKACRSGDRWACFNSGRLMEKTGNYSEASIFYRIACDNGEMSGCESLGLLELKKGNIPAAKFFLKKACNQGYLGACSKLRPE